MALILLKPVASARRVLGAGILEDLRLVAGAGGGTGMTDTGVGITWGRTAEAVGATGGIFCDGMSASSSRPWVMPGRKGLSQLSFDSMKTTWKDSMIR